MVTISWYPGGIKNMNAAKVAECIVRGCQLWQGRCGVRFGVVPAGSKSDITIYPAQGKPPWAMAMYAATGQLLFNTHIADTPERVAALFAHEEGHYFGLGHAPKTRTEALMHWQGSSVDYMDHNEGRWSIARFGATPSPDWPWSLRHVGDKIRKLEKPYYDQKQWYEAADRRWHSNDEKFRFWRAVRDDPDTTDEDRAAAEEKRAFWYSRREIEGTKRANHHAEMMKYRGKLLPLWDQWKRIRKQWSGVGLLNYADLRLWPEEPTACFYGMVDGDASAESYNLLDEFGRVSTIDTCPVPGLTELNT